jgi:hypothetical protein
MSPRLQRQVLVYASLLGLTIVYRLFSPDLGGEALGGLVFLALAGGVGVNYLIDEGYKPWAVWLIGGSVLASNLTFFALIKEGVLVAFFSAVLCLIPAFAGIQWGRAN